MNLSKFKNIKHKHYFIIPICIIIIVIITGCIAHRPTQLPELSHTNQASSPLLWDYYNGTMNNDKNIKLKQYGDSAVIAVYRNNFKTVFISKYYMAKYITTTINGTKPVSYTVTDAIVLKNKLHDVTKDRKFTEHDYAFYIITFNLKGMFMTRNGIYNDAINNQFGGIDLNNIPDK